MNSRYNRFLLSLLLIISVLLTRCAPPDPAHTLTGSWHLIAIQNLDLGESTLEPDHIARPIVIEFYDKGRKGDYFGETVTNEVWGEYRLSEGKVMEFLDIDGTWKGEPDWGKRFREALESVSEYHVSGSLMELSFDESRQKLVFERQ